MLEFEYSTPENIYFCTKCSHYRKNSFIFSCVISFFARFILTSIKNQYYTQNTKVIRKEYLSKDVIMQFIF